MTEIVDNREIAVKLINQHKIKESEIARDIHTAPSTLNYQLHTAKNYNPEMIKDVLNWFKRKGYLVTASQRTCRLIKVTLDVGAMLGNGLSILNSHVSDAVSSDSPDGVELSFKEKKDISNALDQLEADLLASIREIRNMVEE